MITERHFSIILVEEVYFPEVWIVGTSINVGYGISIGIFSVFLKINESKQFQLSVQSLSIYPS